MSYSSLTFHLMLNYWYIMIVFSAISIIVGKGNYMPGDWKCFLRTMLTIDSGYNGAWWYMFAYVLLVIISPIILKMVKNSKPWVVVSCGFLIYFVSYLIRFKGVSFGLNGWLCGKLGPLGNTFFEYLLGAVFCEYRMISKLYCLWMKNSIRIRSVLTFIILMVLLYVRTRIVPSLFVAPISGFIVMMLFHYWNKPEPLEKCFLFVGKHSTNIWLTHMFFMYGLFPNLVYMAKYPILIFVFLLSITIMVSIILQRTEECISKLIKLV